MELLLAVLVNNGMKNMEGYKVSSIYGEEPKNRIRHISENSIYLCNYSTLYGTTFSLYNYSLNNIDGVPNVSICKSCLNKLPRKIREQVVFNLIVTKLKS